MLRDIIVENEHLIQEAPASLFCHPEVLSC
jgi:hypothetical protein